MVPIKKPSKKIQIYMYFRYLNKACPKDDFTLPNIDNLVDATSRHGMILLMDGFSRYNQIKITI